MNLLISISAQAPSCFSSVPPLQQNIQVGTDMTISCGAFVTGRQQPIIVWSGNNVPGSLPNVNSSYVGSTIALVASIPYVPPYTCTTGFFAPGSPPAGMANNAPIFTSTCTSNSITVWCKYSVYTRFVTGHVLIVTVIVFM